MPNLQLPVLSHLPPCGSWDLTQVWGLLKNTLNCWAILPAYHMFSNIYFQHFKFYVFLCMWPECRCLHRAGELDLLQLGIPVASSWPTWLLGTDLGTSAESISSHHHIFLTTKHRSKHLNLAAWKTNSPFSHILLYMSKKLLTYWHVRIKKKKRLSRQRLGVTWHRYSGFVCVLAHAS